MVTIPYFPNMSLQLSLLLISTSARNAVFSCREASPTRVRFHKSISYGSLKNSQVQLLHIPPITLFVLLSQEFYGIFFLIFAFSCGIYFSDRLRCTIHPPLLQLLQPLMLIQIFLKIRSVMMYRLHRGKYLANPHLRASL